MRQFENTLSPEDMTKEQLVSTVYELMMECDERHAHEDALEEQILKLGGVPVSFAPILVVYNEPLFEDGER